MELKQITGTLGAEIRGVDLAHAGSDVVGKITDALSEYKVLVVPDQGALTPQELLSFAECFGVAERAPHPTWDDLPGTVGVKVLDYHYPIGPYPDDLWHTDGATRDNTAWLSFLHAQEVPTYGRDTLYADMEAAYERLSPPLQRLLEGLTALHSWGVQQPDAPPVEHPVILINAKTGRKTLYVNRFYTRSIVGLRRDESDALLRLLFEQAHVPELQLRVSWKPGTLTIWDNERTQHYLVRDRDCKRVLHRVMVATAH